MKTKAYGWVLAALVLGACAQSNVEEASGGQTNWLATCSEDDACEQGECVCGVCTKACASNDECSASFEGSCIELSSALGAAACEGAPAPQDDALCLPACAGDDACGDGFLCRSSVCVTAAAAARLDAAGPPAMADAGDPPSEVDASTLDSGGDPPSGPDASALDSGTDFPSSDANVMGDASVVIVRDGGEVSGRDASTDACNCDLEVQSLACVCDQINCLSFADAVNAPCQSGNANPSLLRSGCGIQIVSRSPGLSASSFAYLSGSKALIAASLHDDVPFGECDLFGYASDMPTITDCADYEVCTLCGESEYPSCAE